MSAAPKPNMAKSVEMFARCKKSIAGGESSYARLRSGIELCLDHTAGSRMWDVDGNEYIDYCLGFGPLIFGHNPQDIIKAVVDQITTKGYHFSFPHELDHKVGEAMQRLIPGVDKIRFTCSGTESTMAAMRLARAYTGKEKIIKFEGAYHGWSDVHLHSVHPSLIQASGRYNAPNAMADSTGIPKAFGESLIIQPFNDIKIIEQTIKQRQHEIAGVIIEPAMANCGIVPPRDGYLQELRALTEKYGVALIFDEVMTGFRIAAGGAQEYWGVTPDICTYAKALGGGFPVACFGGTDEFMDVEACNEVYHGGTYTASPLTLAAADAVLQRIERDKDTMYPELTRLSEKLADGLVAAARDNGFNAIWQGVGPLLQIFFGKDDSKVDKLYNYREILNWVDEALYSKWHQEMQYRGIYLFPSQYERLFMSTAHTDQDIEDTIAIAQESFKAIAEQRDK
jgi:glutamate-1-semialdehyde 2,1-aminomutase